MRAAADEPDEVILSRALLIMQKALERRDEQIARLEPRAAYADEVIDSVSCLTTTQVAKGLGMTAVELNRRLCSISKAASTCFMPNMPARAMRRTARTCTATRRAKHTPVPTLFGRSGGGSLFTACFLNSVDKLTS